MAIGEAITNDYSGPFDYQGCLFIHIRFDNLKHFLFRNSSNLWQRNTELRGLLISFKQVSMSALVVFQQVVSRGITLVLDGARKSLRTGRI